MEKILAAIASLIEDLQKSNGENVELKHKVDKLLLEIAEKNIKIKELETKVAELQLEKLQQPFKPNTVPCPLTPYAPNTPEIGDKPPYTPSTPWNYPIITYINTVDNECLCNY